MTKAEYRRNGTIIRTRYYDTPEQAQDALVKLSLRRWQKITAHIRLHSLPDAEFRVNIHRPHSS